MVDADGAAVVSGLRDLVVLKSTGSEFADFLVDEFTTLPPTHDRVLSTSLAAEWTYVPDSKPDWGPTTPRSAPRCWSGSRTCTRWPCSSRCGRWAGRCWSGARTSSIELVAPNIHHVAVDLSPFGLDNRGEVFHVTDRPADRVVVERDEED